ncbi:MAG: hypothetical protein BWY70_01405 [Bacteroidetes bacterium ADurb.Bin408]|nr:MAG: hypothetical protein BWY70_01405 [Bacteroidetes bacterium ADurb.Bin408]
MKKALTLLMMLFGSYILIAQPCIPGAYTNAGIYPDSAAGLPVATVNVPYNTVITVVVPTDTIMFGSPLTIDSIGVVSVTGFPAGFTYSSNPANGYIHGGSSGCVLITGTASQAQVGSYPINISLESWVNAIPSGFVDVKNGYYTLVIQDVVGSHEINISEPENINYPNPFRTETSISFIAQANEEAILTIFNNIGQVVHTQKIQTIRGLNKINLNLNLEYGIYNYTVTGPSLRLSGKMSSGN